MDNKNTEVFSTESNFFLTAEMLATLSSDVLRDKIDQHDNDCLKTSEMDNQLLEMAKGLNRSIFLSVIVRIDLPNWTSVVNRSLWIMLTLKDL